MKINKLFYKHFLSILYSQETGFTYLLQIIEFVHKYVSIGNVKHIWVNHYVQQYVNTDETDTHMPLWALRTITD